MAGLINVLITIDSESILTKYGPNNDPNNPVVITSPDLTYMISEPDHVLAAGQATEELIIKGTPGDVIQWREISTCMDFNVLLYRSIAKESDKLISTPASLTLSTTVPLFDPENPIRPIMEKITSSLWRSDVLMAGNVVYLFCFMILDRKSNIKSYYCWDPYIHIEN